MSIPQAVSSYVPTFQKLSGKIDYWPVFYKEVSKALRDLTNQTGDYLSFFENTANGLAIEFGVTCKTIEFPRMVEYEGLTIAQTKKAGKLYIRQDEHGDVIFFAVSPHFFDKDPTRRTQVIFGPADPKEFDYTFSLVTIVADFIEFVRDWESPNDLGTVVY